MNGLIIKQKWADLILSGDKTWEIRGSNTKIRGTIAIIKSGTGMIYGTVILANCFQVTQEAMYQGFKNHRITADYDIPYKKCYVWELSSPVIYKRPITYCHPQGAVIWVKVDDEIMRCKAAQS